MSPRDLEPAAAGTSAAWRPGAVALACLALAVFTSFPSEHGSRRGDTAVSVARLAEQARAEAARWRRDAVLVEVEAGNFSFPTDRRGIPDLTRSGPPSMLLFNFFSPAKREAMRVVATPQAAVPPGGRALHVEPLPMPYSTFVLPLPQRFVEVDQAIAAARKGGGTGAVVSTAKLRMFWDDKARPTLPVWTIVFGQDARTLAQPTRQVDARSGAPTEQPDTFDEPRVARDFQLATPARDVASLKKLADAAAQQADPLFKPFAIHLMFDLRNNPPERRQPYPAEAHFYYARLMPTLLWDSLHVGMSWPSGPGTAQVEVRSNREDSPEEPQPRALPTSPRDPSTALRRLLDGFPPGYAESYTTYEKGCHQLMTVSPSIRATECGVYVPQLHRTDRIFVWLSDPASAWWLPGTAPLPPERAYFAAQAPRDAFQWWTRVKHAAEAGRPAWWHYHLIDAESQKPTAWCTESPNETRALTAIPCR